MVRTADAEWKETKKKSLHAHIALMAIECAQQSSHVVAHIRDLQ